MKMQADKVIAVRTAKTVYRDGETAIKVFDEDYSKADVLNEALNQARVEETGLPVPRVLERLIGKVKEAVAEKNFLVRSLFQMAFNAKKSRILQKNTNRCPLWDALIFKPVLAKIGLDNVRAMVTGSAPITAENLLFLRVLFLYSLFSSFSL